MISAATQYLLNRMCFVAQKTALGDTIVALQTPVTVGGDFVFGANGVVNALVAANNVGILSCTQAFLTATANLGGSIYVVGLTQNYAGLQGVSVTPVGQVPASSDLQVVSNAVGVIGGVATIVFTAGDGTDTVTITLPGGSPIVLAATGANSDCWAPGNGGTTDASGFATLINALTAVGAYSPELIAAGNPLYARVIGTCVVLTSSVPGVTIATNCGGVNTHVTMVTDIKHITTAARTMPPGIVFQTAVAVTPHVVASGDEMKVGISLVSMPPQ